MMTREQERQAPAPTVPKCPHCKAEMPHVQWNTSAPTEGAPGGPTMALVTFFCPQCEAAINCQLLPIADVLRSEHVAQIRQAIRAGRPQG